MRGAAFVGSIAANAAVAGLIALVSSLASHDEPEPERKPEPVDIVPADPPPLTIATVDDPPPKLVEPVPPRPHPRRSTPALPRGGHAPGSPPSPPTEPAPTPETTAAGSGSGTGDGNGSGTGSGDGSGSGTGDPGIDRSSPPIPLDANPPRVLPYTTEAMRDRVTGDVQLVLAITADGRVGGVTVRRGLGHGLDEVAATIARAFRFRPALDFAGKPTTGTVRWRFHFAPP